MVRLCGAHAPDVARALLLVVVAMPVSGGVLYDQTDSCTNTFVTSEYIIGTPFYEAVIADDFVVPAGTTWQIDQVSPKGGYFNGGQTAGSFIVTFYVDSAGSPGAAVAGCSYPAAAYRQAGNTFDIALPNSCSLSAGAQGTVYWFSAQANLHSSPVVDWTVQDRSVQSGNPAHARFPGGSDPDCATWHAKQDCYAPGTVGPDQCFSLSSSGTIFRDGFD